MNEMTIAETRTPIEIALGIDENGMTTAKKLYEFLELAPQNYSRWCKTNIIENEFVEENVDYFYSSLMKSENGRGNFAEDYRLTAKFAKSLSQKASGEKGEQARQYFIAIEERTKQQAMGQFHFSSNLQFMKSIVAEMERAEIEQQRQAEQLNRQAKQLNHIEERVDNMREIMTSPIADWRSEINAKVREIAKRSGKEYQTLFTEMYAELEQIAHCSLKRLSENKIARMTKAGNTKTAIKNETTKIAVIEENRQLKAIFEGIVRKYAMAYCA